jgi:hypothetical protein
MNALTLPHAEHLFDLICGAMEKDDDSKIRNLPLNELDAALKLMIAKERQSLADRTDFDAKFDQGVKFYGAGTWHLAQFESFNPVKKGTTELSIVFAKLETGESFGAFCKKLDPKVPDYWEQVYRRIGLPWYVGLPYQNQPQQSETETKKRPSLLQRILGGAKS